MTKHTAPFASATDEVVIIGGGLVGCASALRLRDAGARVTVLEKSVPGAEALIATDRAAWLTRIEDLETRIRRHFNPSVGGDE